MFRNYIRLTFRSIVRDGFHSTINILGLSVGILCAVLVLLFVSDELSYDKHHEKHERIYRLESSQSAITPHPLGPALRDEYTDIAEIVRFSEVPIRLRYKEREFYEKRVYHADETVFDVFTHKFLKGSPEKALEPGTIVLTDSLAQKYFRDENPIGKTIRTREGYDLSVSGVIEDLPGNSHLAFDALISMKTLARSIGESRFNSRDPASFGHKSIGVFTYVLAKDNPSIVRVIADFDRFAERYLAGVDAHFRFELMATPLSDTHFQSDLENDLPSGNIIYSHMLVAVAVCVLLIAAINYMNMALARSARRAKEIWIRKSLGAHRGQIVRQFLTESLVTALLAMLFSIAFTEATLPVFNELSGKDLRLFSSANTGIFLMILVVAIVVGLVSGSYPAFHLSRSVPARMPKDRLKAGGNKAGLKELLVVVQFTLSIAMAIVTLLVTEQFEYLQNKDLGFDKNNVIVMVISMHDRRQRPYLPEAIKAEFLKNPAVEEAAMSNSVPGLYLPKYHFRIERDGRMEDIQSSFLCVDYEYLDLMRIQILKGRSFSRGRSTDKHQGYVINETFAEQSSFEGNPRGKRVQFLEFDGTVRDGEVIGVVKDFNFGSLHNAPAPLIIFMREGVAHISLRIGSGKAHEAISLVKRIGREFDLSSPLEYFFLDEILGEYYRHEERLGRIFGSLTAISIFISCLGLLGLSSYLAAQRTKEIGIRAVMGASRWNLVWLLSKEFVMLLVAASILAWPVAYYAVTKWLEDYPYRMDIGILPFIGAGALALLITLLTVGVQAFKAASADPIESLRYE